MSAANLPIGVHMTCPAKTSYWQHGAKPSFTPGLVPLLRFVSISNTSALHCLLLFLGTLEYFITHLLTPLPHQRRMPKLPLLQLLLPLPTSKGGSISLPLIVWRGQLCSSRRPSEKRQYRPLVGGGSDSHARLPCLTVTKCYVSSDATTCRAAAACCDNCVQQLQRRQWQLL